VRVLVVGGGITGLTAAHALQAAGAEVVLVEAATRLGGKVATSRLDGFVIEHGPDSFLTTRPVLLDLCRGLGLDGELVAPSELRSVHVLWRGRLTPLPDGLALVAPTRLAPFLRTPLLGPLDKLRAGLDLFLPRSAATADPAIGPFVRRRLGSAVAERIAAPLLGGIGGGDIERLSQRATFPQLWEMEQRHGSLIRAALAAGRAARPTGSASASPFLTLRSGMGHLVDRLAVALVRTEVRLGGSVTALEVLVGGYRATLADGATLDAERLVLAVPASSAARLLRGLAPVAAERLRDWPVGSSAVVTLAYRASDLPTLPAGHGFVVAPGELLRIGAVTFSSAKWPDRAPRGASLLRVFVARGHEPLDGNDDHLTKRIREDLERVLGIVAEPILVRVDRQRETMPQYLVGHRARLDAAEAALAREQPGIALAGASYRGVGLTDCVAQAMAAAERVTAVGEAGLGPVAASFHGSGRAADASR
jgi:protoporphyrinogen/coproporphyrinogen III oxidase